MENRLAQHVPNLLFSLGHHSVYTSISRHYMPKPRCYWHTNESYSFLFLSAVFCQSRATLNERDVIHCNGKTEGREKRRERGKKWDRKDTWTKYSYHKNVCLISYLVLQYSEGKNVSRCFVRSKTKAEDYETGLTKTVSVSIKWRMRHNNYGQLFLRQ